MTLISSKSLALGAPLIPFSLPATDGKGYGPLDFKDRKILIVIFMCNHCPYVQAVIQRLITLQNDYAEKGVQLLGINANDEETYPQDSFEAMQAWAKEKGMNFPYLRDESQHIALMYQAQCTPDIYVFDEERKLAYHGRVDDNWKEPEKATQHDLKNALEALLQNKPVPEPQIPSMGCSIKWKESERVKK